MARSFHWSAALVSALLLAGCASQSEPAGEEAEGGAGGADDASGGTGGVKGKGGSPGKGGSGGTPSAANGGTPASGGSPAEGGAGGSAEPPDAAPAADVGTEKPPVTVTDPGTEGDGDYTIGPAYTPSPDYVGKPDVPKGTITTFTMKSSESKFYPGLNGPYMRNVNVYVPKQYVAGTAAPFIVAHDGKNWVPRFQGVLDNLIAAKKLPVMIAIMVDNGGGDSKGSERGLEYDTVSGKFAEFIEAEVLPRVETEAKVKLTKDPEGRATMGGSSGGAAAFSMGWYHPELYRKILTYSGTYVNQQSPTNPMSPHGAWEYHEHFIPMSEPKPLRVWLQVGENDNGAGSSAAGLHNWVLANQNMAKVLAAKKYHYHFDFSKAAGHVDGKVVQQTLPAAMLWLWRGYPIE